MGCFRLLIYGIIAGVFLYALGYDYLYMPRIGHDWWIYKFVMLTMIDLALQAVYYSICFVCALMDCARETADRGPHRKHPTTPSYWRNSKLHRICDFMYFTGALPVGMATCLIYWCLYAIEPTLVQPEWALRLIPSFMEHVMHTAPVPFILVDTLLSCHRAPPREQGFAVISAFAVLYFMIVFAVRMIDGFWLYPFMEYLSPIGFILLFLASSGSMLLLYYIGDVLNMMLWGAATHSQMVEKRK